jgi:PPOX class probable F420-dependent enzyme
VSRRDAIRMTGEEVAAFLAGQRTVVCATNGRDGWPHLMPLWYVIRERSGGEGSARDRNELWAWTYARSQKVRNLERDPRCTLQVESGTEYAELRGVMIKAECELVRDPDAVAAIGAELAARYAGASLDGDVGEAMRRQAAKRVGLRFIARATATWDHRKLGGTY